MPFVARESFWSMRLPAKVYVHEAGIARAFGSNYYAARHAVEIIEHAASGTFDPRAYDFLLAAVWGDGKDKVAEFFRYKGTGDWPGNPEMKAFVFKNGVWQPDPEAHECEDTTIMRGKEALHRRTSRNVEQYLSTFPDLGELYIGK